MTYIYEKFSLSHFIFNNKRITRIYILTDFFKHNKYVLISNTLQNKLTCQKDGT